MSVAVTQRSGLGNDPVLADGPTFPVRWTPELLVDLDWKRFCEISRAVAQYTGYVLGPTTVEPDGSAEFTIHFAQDPRHTTALVRLAPWDHWLATAECVELFKHRMSEQGFRTGIYMAPRGFTTSAVHAAIAGGVQRVDAPQLAARLAELPQEYSEFYYDIGTAGDSTTPTCPGCFRRLTKTSGAGVSPMDLAKMPDLTYRSSDIIADMIVARRVEIMPECEVQFLLGVHAQDLVVHGVANGDFVCERNVLLNPGATLYGSVAARSVHVRPGGQLHGKTRILQTAPEALEPVISPVWRCQNARGTAVCAEVQFLLH